MHSLLHENAVKLVNLNTINKKTFKVHLIKQNANAPKQMINKRSILFFLLHEFLLKQLDYSLSISIANQ